MKSATHRATRRTGAVFAAMLGFGLAVPTTAAIADPDDPVIVDSIVIAEGVAEGYRVTALAVKYSDVLDLGLATIPNSTYAVHVTLPSAAGIAPGPRTITRVYTYDQPLRSERGKPGEYVIIEMDLREGSQPNVAISEANYYARNYSVIFDLTGTYEVRQVADIQGDDEVIPGNPALTITNSTFVRPDIDQFTPGVFTHPNGTSLTYRQFTPQIVRDGLAGDQKFPLVLALHGMGSSGTDNISSIVAEGMVMNFVTPGRQAETPAFVLAPQRTTSQSWVAPAMQETLVAWIDDVVANAPIDPNRIYLVGLSMGSQGAWTLLNSNPDLFAASLQSAGFQVPATAAERLRDLPIWAVHSPEDELCGYDVPGAPLRTMQAWEAEGIPVAYDGWDANLPVAEADARASIQTNAAAEAGAIKLFTTYTPGTNPQNFEHASWIPA